MLGILANQSNTGFVDQELTIFNIHINLTHLTTTAITRCGHIDWHTPYDAIGECHRGFTRQKEIADMQRKIRSGPCVAQPLH